MASLKGHAGPHRLYQGDRQKITKAMARWSRRQNYCAAAQTVAEAGPRPYAEKMDAVISNICRGKRRGSPGNAGAAGRNRQRIRLHLPLGLHRRTRPCPAPFNSSIVPAGARGSARAFSLINQGKEVKVLLRRPQGLRGKPAPQF